MSDIAAGPDPPDGDHGGRPRWRRWVAVGVVAPSVVFALALLAPRPQPAGGGRRAPSFTLPRLDDPAATISLEPRGRPVVVNFWASWCVPCRKEMPALQSVSSALRGRVDFVGINNQDSRSDALKLVADTGITYPSGFDPEGNVARSFGIFGMPTTVFVDGRGRIVEQRTGELSRAELEQAIQRAFGVKT